MLGVRYQYGVKNTPKDYGQAMQFYTKACKLGYMDSCGGVGNMYKKGLGVPVDYVKAYKYLLKSCNANISLSCDDLAHLYEKGWGVKKNKATARMYYAKACKGTYKNSCISLGVYYQYGLGGLKKNIPTAISHYTTACNKRGGEGCYLLGKLYQSGTGVVANQAEARRLFNRGCSLGYKRACNMKTTASNTKGIDASDDASAAEARLLGKTPPSTNTASNPHIAQCKQGKAGSCSLIAVYYQGGTKGFPKDFKKAFTYYERGCTLGSKTGCGGLGYLYKQGLGTPKNFPMALKYLRKACAQSDALSCHDLGQMYEKGMGTTKNYIMARTKYEQACKGTYKKSCVNVGVYHQYGLGGLAKNFKTAAKYYNIGCTAKRGEGCYLLGKLYRDGKGVRRNASTAKALFRKGCSLRFKKSCDAQ